MPTPVFTRGQSSTLFLRRQAACFEITLLLPADIVLSKLEFPKADAVSVFGVNCAQSEPRLRNTGHSLPRTCPPQAQVWRCRARARVWQHFAVAPLMDGSGCQAFRRYVGKVARVYVGCRQPYDKTGGNARRIVRFP